ncbi:MAG: 50S ribosome-binding GTPase [Candidatus Wallbacteria bacterium]|nr:50S ribosome-binding GTPase [Candidatus Wallbacteria bacterium]
MGPLELHVVRFRDVPVLQEVLASASLLVEVRDARIPMLSAAWPLPRRFQAKERVLVLNKTDRAEPNETARWVEELRRQGQTVLTASAIAPGQAVAGLRTLLQERGDARRGRALLRAAIIGLPNVGKSTLLNALVRASRSATGDRPGITVGKQWVKLGPAAYLLDSPGAMPLADGIERRLPEQAFKLALCRILPDGRVEPEDVAVAFLEWLRRPRASARASGPYAELLAAQTPPFETLDLLARRLSLLAPGGRPDSSAAARRIMVDFASGKLGRFTLERVPQAPTRPESQEARSR